MTDLLERTRTESMPAESSRRVRMAWMIPGAILAVASLVWGTLNVVGLVAHGEYSTTSTFDAGAIDSVEIVNDNGTVNVIAVAVEAGGMSDEIVVTSDVSDGWRSSELTAEVSDGVLRIRGGCPFLGSPWCNVGVTVSLPADRPVTVHGSNGSIRATGLTAPLVASIGNGSIELEDIAAPFEASSDNGRIIGRRLTSPVVEASTDNGSIELSFLDPPQMVTGRSANGRMEVVLPEEVAYRVDARSSNGSVDTTVRTDPSSGYVINVSSDNGSVTVRPSG